MLRQLRFDIYKILKSPIMWAVFALSLSLIIALPIKCYTEIYDFAEGHFKPGNGSTTAMGCMTGYEFYTYMALCVIFFVAFFVGKDYTSGYYKNIGYAINKTYYVLSKVVWIALFAVLWFLLYFLMNIIVCVAMGGSVYYDPRDFFLGMSLRVLSAIAFGTVVMFLLFASKSMIVALVVPLIFLFTWGFAEDAIDRFIMQAFHLADLEKNRILWRFSIMNYYGFYGGAGGYFSSRTDTATIYLTLLVYCALAIGFSILICYMRKRKN